MTNSTVTADAPFYFTASQTAAFLTVDLKTVHNYVDRKRLVAFRTPGRHLRITPEALYVFMKRYGYTIPYAVKERLPAADRVRLDAEATPSAPIASATSPAVLRLLTVGHAWDLAYNEASLDEKLIAKLRGQLADAIDVAVHGLSDVEALSVCAAAGEIVASGGNVAVTSDVTRALVAVDGGVA